MRYPTHSPLIINLTCLRPSPPLLFFDRSGPKVQSPHDIPQPSLVVGATEYDVDAPAGEAEDLRPRQAEVLLDKPPLVGQRAAEDAHVVRLARIGGC